METKEYTFTLTNRGSDSNYKLSLADLEKYTDEDGNEILVADENRLDDSKIRYILLKDEQDKISTKLENLLCTVFNKEETKWKINEDFSNSFYFSRTSEDGYFETMLIKYKYNSKKDEFKFILAAGPVGWDVTLQELKTLIEKKSSTNNNLCLDKPNSDDISFRYNDMEIIIRKIV